MLDLFRHQKKVSFDGRENLDRDWEILILSRHHLPVPKVSFEIEKSVDTGHFWQILFFLDLDQELVNLILFLDQDFSTCWDFWWWVSIMLRYLNKSQKVSTNVKNLNSLNLSRQSRFISTISINISTKINLNWKILIY